MPDPVAVEIIGSALFLIGGAIFALISRAKTRKHFKK